MESLGDNAEIDHVLEALAGRSSDSLFRWMAAPMPTLTGLLDQLPSFVGYEFDNLHPAAPGMVLDKTLGLRFHSGMRSSEINGQLVFDDDEQTRQETHQNEKRRFDRELQGLSERLRDGSFRIFIVKANAGVANNAVLSLESALRRHCNDAFVLVVVSELAEPAALDWLSDTCVLTSIRRLAPYAAPKQVDLVAWRSLFDQLANDPLMLSALSSKCIESRFAHWNTALSLDEKEEHLHTVLRTLESLEELGPVMKDLARVDSHYHRYQGGDILKALGSEESSDAIAANAPESLAEDFDNRYLRLMALHSNIDVVAAREINALGEVLYQRFGKSYVRYSRIDGSMENARGLLAHFESINQDIVPVSPMSDASFAAATLAEGSAPDTFASAGGPRSTLLDVVLETERTRQFDRLSEHDDTDRAEPRWLELRREDTIKKLSFHVLNDARVSWRPSSVIFSEADTLRYATSTSDMYHHSRVVGRVGLGKGKSRVPVAYFLPRFGPPENHYHTLVDKLPTLFGYKLLGLNCPLVAAYQPNDTMHQMMDLMGIERELVEVDLWSDFTAERGIVPTPARLRPLFVDFCASLPRGQSPLGSRVYISRGDASGRGMQNEAEVEALLQQYDFDIVRMEEHDFEAQRAICANAEIIMAPHGAGMTNMIFAPRGCSIVELIPERYMVRFFWQLAVDCGHRYAVLVGQMNETRSSDGPIGQSINWSTDIKALQRLLDDLDSSRFRRSA